MHQKVIIVGAGPAGLFCADLLLQKGFNVELYDHSSGPAKKFLIAGNGGLNLTHSEELSEFVKKYEKNAQRFASLLEKFSPQDLQNWCSELGVETFVGSSGRVFPKEMSAGKMLVKWLERLKSHSCFKLFLHHKFTGLTKEKTLNFLYEGRRVEAKSEYIVLALGGSSWKKTGSDGEWIDIIKSLGIKTKEFLPMNCGFEREWSDFFKKNCDRAFLKHVEISFQGRSVKGDLMLTSYGVEGGVVYALSHLIREAITKSSQATLCLDLFPALSKDSIIKKIEKRNAKTSLSNHLRKSLGLKKESFIFLKEILSPSDFECMSTLGHKLKNIPLTLVKARPIDEAISTAGGVCFSDLTDSFESKALGGLFFSGEMLDYEAPTGGYLLQACFSLSFTIASEIERRVISLS